MPCSRKLYHAGFRARSPGAHWATPTTQGLAHLRDFAQVLIRRGASIVRSDDFGLALKQTAYALDSTTIDLCLALFPWARFRRHKGAVSCTR